MPTDKGLIPNTSAISRHRSFGYINSEKEFTACGREANELRLENQALIFDFEHHFKTTS